MTHQQIIADLKSQGNYNVRFHEDGTITSKYGKATTNYWIVIDGQLRCINCKTSY